jgi:hypothetical protein
MAPRKPSKVQSRQKQAPEPVGIVTTVLTGGRSGALSNGKNGHSPSFEQIQLRAYEIFEARGGTHGWDLADWFTAERELTATSAAGHWESA